MSNKPKNGLHQEFYGNRLHTSGNYDHGLRAGFWSFYYPNQKPNFEGLFKDGLKEGQWTYFNAKGRLASRATFSQDSLHGDLLIYDKSQNPKAQYRFIHGRFSGDAILYQNGVKESTIGRLSSSARRITKFHANGQVKSSCTEWKGLQNDTVHTYHANARAFETLVFYRSLLLSTSDCFDSTGKILDNGSLTDGSGLLKRYYADGSMRSKVYYRDGLRHGIGEYYHPNGQLRTAGLYRDGSKKGVWKQYKPTGELVAEDEQIDQELEPLFDREFGIGALRIESANKEARFPGGDRALNKVFRKELSELEFLKGRKVWLHLDLDEMGYVTSVELSYKGEIDSIPEARIKQIAMELPRWSPAYSGGVTQPSEAQLIIEL